MNRIEKLQQIAKENGVAASIKELGGKIFANINGVSFQVNGFASFDAKCRELSGYVAPQPIDLTARLAKIENAAIERINQ